MLIDTHSHLYSDEFKEDLDAVITRALEQQLKYILLPNVDKDSISAMEFLAEKSPVFVQMMGLHPAYVKEDWQEQLALMKQKLFDHPEKYCAVGEIGMDLYWDKTFKQAQKDAFREQINWAKTLKKPIAIHVREAFDEVFEILDETNDANLSGVFHCFTGNEAQANKAIAYGQFKLGIGGVVTYKNSHLPAVLATISPEHLVLETDAPYLPPVPFRGKRNESSYVKYVAEKLSDIYAIPITEIERITSENAVQLFGLNN